MIRYKEIVLFYISVVLIGLFEYYLADLKVSNAVFYSILFSIVVTKLAGFLYFAFKRMMLISQPGISYFSFLVFVAVNILLIIVSFSADFFNIFIYDPEALSGMEEAT